MAELKRRGLPCNTPSVIGEDGQNADQNARTGHPATSVGRRMGEAGNGRSGRSVADHRGGACVQFPRQPSGHRPDFCRGYFPARTFPAC
jgi:hypothetical protein